MLKLYTGTAASGLPQLRTQNKPPIGDPPMEEIRKNPDQPFRAGPMKDSGKTQGKLKLFFGYAAGVGKTCAMLEVAHRAKERGTDVVAGFVEPHAWPETAALLQGLEQLPDPPVSISLIGGGGREADWCQILADVLGHDITVLDGTEFRAAQALAALARQGADAPASAEDGRIYHSRGEYRALYDRQYARYQKLYPALRELSE